MQDDIEARRLELYAAAREAHANYQAIAATTPLGNSDAAFQSQRLLQELQEKAELAEAERKAFDEEHPIGD